jgi:transposase-like protein
VTDTAATGTVEHSLVCPHCNKAFRAKLMAGAAARYSGFKCPHCRLFVPRERVEDQLADG